MSIDTPEFKPRLNQLCRITKLIPRDIRAREAELMARKWPAYRFLSPLETTRLFHAEYVNAYKAYYRNYIDRDAGDAIRIGTKLLLYQQNAPLTQVWKARQLADDLGLPYPDYMEFVFGFAAERRRQHAPQPNQLGPNGKTREAWVAKLEAFWTPERDCLALTRMDPMLQYATEHDRGLPAQRGFRQELVQSEAASGRALDSFIGRYVVSLRYLRLEACAPLGEDAVASAFERVNQEPDASFYTEHSHERPGPESFLQSCFGLPGIEANDPACRGCPLHHLCTATRAVVTDRVRAETGVEEPVEERRKRKNRERVARHRARKKQEVQRNAMP